MASRRIYLADWEQDAILSMDAVRCEMFETGTERVSARKLTPDLFNALF